MAEKNRNEIEIYNGGNAANHGKKVSAGERILNSIKKKARPVKEGFIKGMNRDNDEKLQYAGDNNIVDFDEALRHANTTVDPHFRKEASDGKDGPEHEEPLLGRRSIDEHVERANERLAEANEEYRRAINERVAETEKDIEKFMDENETDILSSDGLIRGYHVVMQRTPAEKDTNPNDLDVMAGGKKVSVFKTLKGESVRTDSPVPEYSSALAQRAAREMASSGSMEWTGEVKGGAGVSHVAVSVEASLGKGPVDVIIKNDPITENTIPGKTATTYIPAGKYISREEWDRCYKEMLSNKRGAYSFTMEDGTVVSCYISARCNGNNMSIGGLISNDNANYHIDKKTWNSVYTNMMNNGRQMYSLTDDFGDRFDYRLNVMVDGKEAKIDHLGVLEGKKAGEIPAKVVISRETYEKEVAKAANDPSLSGQSQIVTQDGKKLNFKVKTTIDGKDAIPNIPIAGDDIRQFKGGGIMIGRELAKKAIDEMNKTGATFCRLTAKDGREYKFSREGRLTLFVNGKEFSRFSNDPARRKGYKAAVCEVAGLMNTPEQEKHGMDIRGREMQKTIAQQRFLGQLPYTGAGYAVRGAASGINKANITTNSLLGALLRGVMGATRSRGI